MSFVSSRLVSRLSRPSFTFFFLHVSGHEHETEHACSSELTKRTWRITREQVTLPRTSFQLHGNIENKGHRRGRTGNAQCVFRPRFRDQFFSPTFSSLLFFFFFFHSFFALLFSYTCICVYVFLSVCMCMCFFFFFFNRDGYFSSETRIVFNAPRHDPKCTYAHP